MFLEFIDNKKIRVKCDEGEMLMCTSYISRELYIFKIIIIYIIFIEFIDRKIRGI
jgi:hypothetical protein